MRVFLAGATGEIGVRLVPLLLEAGHVVAGMKR
jgi:nucleoside-diphosphate-sugar epimerase